jgi:hypothetical protein
MEALFIGQTYIDVTIRAESMPTGDEKAVAHDYAVSFGGNAVAAAFTCAKLGIVPDVVTSLADDWLGRMFLGSKNGPRHVRSDRSLPNLPLDPASHDQSPFVAQPHAKVSPRFANPTPTGDPHRLFFRFSKADRPLSTLSFRDRKTIVERQ